MESGTHAAEEDEASRPDSKAKQHLRDSDQKAEPIYRCQTGSLHSFGASGSGIVSPSQSQKTYMDVSQQLGPSVSASDLHLKAQVMEQQLHGQLQAQAYLQAYHAAHQRAQANLQAQQANIETHSAHLSQQISMQVQPTQHAQQLNAHSQQVQQGVQSKQAIQVHQVALQAQQARVANFQAQQPKLISRQPAHQDLIGPSNVTLHELMHRQSSMQAQGSAPQRDRFDSKQHLRNDEKMEQSSLSQLQASMTRQNAGSAQILSQKLVQNDVVTQYGAMAPNSQALFEHATTSLQKNLMDGNPKVFLSNPTYFSSHLPQLQACLTSMQKAGESAAVSQLRSAVPPTASNSIVSVPSQDISTSTGVGAHGSSSCIPAENFCSIRNNYASASLAASRVVPFQQAVQSMDNRIDRNSVVSDNYSRTEMSSISAIAPTGLLISQAQSKTEKLLGNNQQAPYPTSLQVQAFKQQQQQQWQQQQQQQQEQQQQHQQQQYQHPHSRHHQQPHPYQQQHQQLSQLHHQQHQYQQQQQQQQQQLHHHQQQQQVLQQLQKQQQKQLQQHQQHQMQQQQFPHPHPISQSSSMQENTLPGPTSGQGLPQNQMHKNAHSVIFTRQQLAVLRAQILAFRRLKRGDFILSDDMLRAITPIPLLSIQNQPPGPTVAVERTSNIASTGRIPHVQASVTQSHAISEAEEKLLVQPTQKFSENYHQQNNSLISADIKNSPPKHMHTSKSESSEDVTGKVKQEVSTAVLAPAPTPAPAPAPALAPTPVPPPSNVDVMDVEPVAADNAAEIQEASDNIGLSTAKTMSVPPSQILQKSAHVVSKYQGPLFDSSLNGKRFDGFASYSNPSYWGNPVSLQYNVRKLLLEEGDRIIGRKRAQKLKLLDDLLSTSYGGYQVRPDQKLRLRIAQRKLSLMDLQARIRNEVEQHQQDIMAMSERDYRKFVRFCERQRAEITRQAFLLQKSGREKQLRALFQWRKKLLEAQWVCRDARISRNRGVAKYHEKMLREFSKRKDEDRNKRMEALKNNDVDAYREMLRQQQTELPGDAGARFEVLTSFLTQTEEYLHKLGGKISAVKTQQEKDEAIMAAAAAARAQGLSEEEIEEASMQAEEALSIKRWSSDDEPTQAASVNKYYSLAHAVNEQIRKQPSMLRAGTLRDYQLVGLQWMLSLYNNRLNGILADEMGLGKTVQVMALIAYLMEHKGNYGPHLIIVPNAVIVNWKSELLRWLPSVICIFYVGGKDQRSKIYSQEVAAMKFNILVTTYEFIMRDRAKLSKVDWKYLIIDEAQRMKDRESRLARDLDRFRCQRRLLLTGTPLQNDLHELWSLLNLVLPEVFDSSKVFHDWFSRPFQKEGTQTSEDDWLETEKKIIVIHRLHQILEPFMLRRRVEDVEGSLPPKVSIVLKCKMSALQAAIYDWVKATATIRLDPEDEAQRVAGSNGKRQVRAYAPLHNKCMELRKVCNHPYLNYPPYGHQHNDNVVRFCGKLWMLDRILLKLHRTGHKVLLFSTMTRLLDILEEYLVWRRLVYRRIDGTTNLDSRESAIVDFNDPDTHCFIFLLSIRAAGRGLNLQTADTVVIYDPDPNPKNEEQAVARAHRIGQNREVRVLYLEAVVETISSYQKEDELRSGASIDIDDEMAGKDRYMGSVESLVRNNIQQHKIDMADEVINAGRFDQRTTQEERRLTLEALLHDEERYQETVHDVPTMQEVNRLIARTDAEIEIFDQMDEDCDWPGEMLKHHEVPAWLRAGSHEVNAAIVATSKQALKRGFFGVVGTMDAELAAEENARSELPGIVKHLTTNYKRGKVDDDIEGEGDRVSREESDEIVAEEDFLSGEEGEIREGFEDDEEGEVPEAADDVDEFTGGEIRPDESEDELKNEVEEEIVEVIEEMEVVDDIDDVVDQEDEDPHDEVSFNSDDEDEESRGTQDGDEIQLPVSKKFGSLAALESRSTKQVVVESLGGEELEEGEIAASADSPNDTRHSSSSMNEHDQDQEQEHEQEKEREQEGEHEHVLEQEIEHEHEQEQEQEQEQKRGQDHLQDQVVQPQKKRKRSMRYPRKMSLDDFVEKNTDDDSDRDSYPVNPMQPPTWQDYDNQNVLQRVDHRTDHAVNQQVDWSDSWQMNPCHGPYFHASYSDRLHESYENWHPWFGLPHNRLSGFQEHQGNNMSDSYRESRSSKPAHTTGFGGYGGAKMSESIQKKCKVVLSKLQGAVNRDGHRIAAKLMELPKYSDHPDYYKLINKPIDSQMIEDHLNCFEYATLQDFAGDVQLMLDNAARYDPDLQADARRLQGLFFERMGLMFPDTDLSSIRISIGVAVQPSRSSRSQRKGELNFKLPRNSLQASERQTSVDGEKEVKQKIKSKKQGKAGRHTQTEIASIKGGNSSKDMRVVDLHPLDFVVHRKKRNPRQRSNNGGSGLKKRTHSVKKSKLVKSCGGSHALPIRRSWSPGTSRRIETCNIKVVGDEILNPRKKMRTDVGKRRPALY